MWYASKYICKADEEQAHEQLGGSVGRGWGILGRESLPWASVTEYPLTEEQRRKLMRVSRRYVQTQARQRGRKFHLRSRLRGWSWFASTPETWHRAIACG
jgi:hypothetical protein